jgi:hypothetical protein
MVCITTCLLCLCGAGSWAEALTGVCEMLTGWIGNCTTCTICYGSNIAGWAGTSLNLPNCVTNATGWTGTITSGCCAVYQWLPNLPAALIKIFDGIGRAITLILQVLSGSGAFCSPS